MNTASKSDLNRSPTHFISTCCACPCILAFWMKMEPHVAKDRRGCTVLPVDKLHISVLCVDLEFFETIAFCPLTRKVDNKYFLLLLFPIFLL